MSSSHNMNRIGGSLPVAPPPPILTTHARSRRDGDRISRRSRSRSRNRDSRPERFHSRGRRSSSPSSSSYRRREGKPSGSYTSGAPPVQQIPQQQTISVIPPKDIPQIIRRILNADDIKMPRRPHEGKKPLFDRDELREGMASRMRSGCDDDVASVIPHLEQQVVAIIREPVISRDLSFASASLNLHLPSSVLEAQQISPGQFSGSGSVTNFRRQSLSPRSRGMGVLTSRSLERIDRELRERDRERERDRRERDRGNPHPPEVASRVRSRSRSMEIRRAERVRRSRSRTPSPMPSEMRRQLEYEDRDLRSSLSRPPGKPHAPKFYGEHDRREPSTSYRGRGSFRGSRRPFRGRGFVPRGSRGGHYERERSGFWQHDMYEREEQESGGSKH